MDAEVKTYSLPVDERSQFADLFGLLHTLRVELAKIRKTLDKILQFSIKLKNDFVVFFGGVVGQGCDRIDNLARYFCRSESQKEECHVCWNGDR
jgi:hypothetical protein